MLCSWIGVLLSRFCAKFALIMYASFAKKASAGQSEEKPLRGVVVLEDITN